MSLPLVTRFGADPILDLEVANKRYVDTSGGGATVTIQNITAASFSTSSTSFVDWTDATLDLPTRAGGFSHLMASYANIGTATSPFNIQRFDVGGTLSPIFQAHAASANWRSRNGIYQTELDGDTAKLEARVLSGTVELFLFLLTSYEVS